jgi:hypothetical protein
MERISALGYSKSMMNRKVEGLRISISASVKESCKFLADQKKTGHYSKDNMNKDKEEEHLVRNILSLNRFPVN